MTTKEADLKAPDGEGPTGAEARGANAPGAATTAPPAPPAAQALPFDEASFRLLVEGANGGDRQALLRLRRLLDEHPRIWQRAGDLSALAERAWTGLLVGRDRLGAESVARTVGALKEALAGPAP